MSLTDFGYVIMFVLPFAIMGFISWLKFNHTKMIADEEERTEFSKYRVVEIIRTDQENLRDDELRTK